VEPATAKESDIVLAMPAGDGVGINAAARSFCRRREDGGVKLLGIADGRAEGLCASRSDHEPRVDGRRRQLVTAAMTRCALWNLASGREGTRLFRADVADRQWSPLAATARRSRQRRRTRR